MFRDNDYRQKDDRYLQVYIRFFILYYTCNLFAYLILNFDNVLSLPLSHTQLSCSGMLGERM